MLEGSPYLDPDEAAYCAQDATDKALGSVIARLVQLALEQQRIHEELDGADDELTEALEWRLKQLRNEIRDWQRIQSGLQSRLRAGS